jgi:serine/threonine-protein kinase RsbW
MKTSPARTVKLDFSSRLDMLDLIQVVLTHVSGVVGFDEEATHYMSVAVRESVVNAIKHGNLLDESKRVAVEFVFKPDCLEVEVADEGAGFDPDHLPDPLAEENLLKAFGRGIFFMRSFMDEVAYSFPLRGGTVVRLVKRLPHSRPA